MNVWVHTEYSQSSIHTMHKRARVVNGADFELCVDSIHAAEIGIAAGVDSLEVCSVRPARLWRAIHERHAGGRRSRLAVSRRRLGSCAPCWTSSLEGTREI